MAQMACSENYVKVNAQDITLYQDLAKKRIAEKLERWQATSE
eukprot:CAMPEP_0185599628 /NCGR_PEP_ID=MMETSP0434-20130131/82834_1 /TAXON_ID=626734 ORGANISM="Favella taraikaensis, Strain Fe Narragansett Bay" /NCGR_SAMPLE_ID=MMETSP0434 /ASSEMBLY_ACC=CAM_ASM_000379 /LENGTH=41 /DNA_ID= /DNA_START= /DNA_END= /DNA_ORIENTATION=